MNTTREWINEAVGREYQEKVGDVVVTRRYHIGGKSLPAEEILRRYFNSRN